MGASATDIEQVIAELRIEFIEDAIDHIERSYELIDEAEKNNDKIDENMLRIKRNIHSLKGQGGSFGFPSITRIMHNLEDFFETSYEFGAEQLAQIRQFFDVVSDILEAGEDLPEDDLRATMARLRARAQSFGSGQELKDIPALLVMGSGVQRSLVGKELVSCGFRVVTSDDPVGAIDVALSALPKFAIINKLLPGVSGVELSNVFTAIKALADCKIIILTSDDDVKQVEKIVSKDTVILHNDESFYEKLTDQLIDWGLFGEIA